MRGIYKSIFSTKNVKPENRNFYQITQVAFFFGMISHAGTILLFHKFEISQLVWFNAFYSVPAFALALYLNRRGFHNFAFLWAYSELLLHQVATTYFLGWGSGAYYWLIYLAGLSFFNSQWKLRTQLVLLLTVILTFISLYLFVQEGASDFDIKLINEFSLINGVSVLFVLSLLIYYFSTTTFKAEERLKKEQELTKSMLSKIEGLFGQQVSKEIAQEMIDSENEIKSRSYSATVMFMDIRDFTLFADSRPPKEVAQFQNTVFSALIDIVGKHHGVVLQLLGDGIMAVFGAPNPRSTHSQDAVNASFEMINKIEDLISEKKIPEINVGIGLNSGIIIAGNLGNKSRKSYSLTGKNVIIAARIEPLNKKFNSRFLISESVFKSISKDHFEIEDMGEIGLKGIEKPVRIYKLL